MLKPCSGMDKRVFLIRGGEIAKTFQNPLNLQQMELGRQDGEERTESGVSPALIVLRPHQESGPQEKIENAQ